MVQVAFDTYISLIVSAEHPHAYDAAKLAIATV
jgi:hypothetical protein